MPLATDAKMPGCHSKSSVASISSRYSSVGESKTRHTLESANMTSSLNRASLRMPHEMVTVNADRDVAKQLQLDGCWRYD
jgi:hypothetical protein